MSPLPPDIRELAGSTDARHVEHTLDGLLACGFDPTAPPLSKTLCRHDASIDPAAAGCDVHADGKMRDSEPEAPP
jgi:hypothetical protein